MGKDDLELFLMHRDRIVAQMSLGEGNKLYHISINEPNKAYLPMGAQLNMVRFHEWWEDRAVPRTRQGAKPALKKLGYSTTGDMLIDNLALSLTDSYWIKPRTAQIRWDDVNLFRNHFVDYFGEITINKNADVRQRSKFSLATSAGEVRKKWVIRENGRRAMVKGNWAESYQQSINEAFASLLHEKQGMKEYTKYELLPLDIKDDSLGLGCICDCFTDYDTEFVSAWEIMQSGKKYTQENYFMYFKRRCMENGMNEIYFDRFMSYMIMTDFLLTNTDRHMNNIGILRDAKNLKWKGFAPIYDTGNSMFFRDMELLHLRFSDIKLVSFTTREQKQMKLVRYRDLVDINKLPTKEEFLSFYERDIPWRRARNEDYWRLFNKKIEMLVAFQSRGANAG